MSDLKPPSQNSPGERPSRARTAIRRGASAVPTATKTGFCASGSELVMGARVDEARQANALKRVVMLAERTQATYLAGGQAFAWPKCLAFDAFSHSGSKFACPRCLIPSNYNLRSQLWRATHSPSQ